MTKKGTQKGKKRGFYSRALDEAERLGLDEARDIEGLDEEIAVLRFMLRELIEKAREEYNPPPEAPREAIWAAIERRRERSRFALRRRLPGSRWIWWPAAAAAVLALGIFIGRLWLPEGTPERVAEVKPAPPGPEVTSLDESGGEFFRTAANRFLSRFQFPYRYWFLSRFRFLS